MQPPVSTPTPGILDLPPPKADFRANYGPDRLQFGDLRLPASTRPAPVVVCIHGGFWRSRYTLEHLGHLCAAITAAGYATWSLEYRRTGDPGGGWPGTFEDVSLGLHHLAQLASQHPIDPQRVALIGHSAGGHLALWLAAQNRWLRGAVSLAGVTDLRRAHDLQLGRGVVQEFLGATPAEDPERYLKGSPIELLPFGVRQRLVHGTNDDTVPFALSRDYVTAAQAKGDDAQLIALEGAGHFELIDPRTKEWPAVLKTLRELF